MLNWDLHSFKLLEIIHVLDSISWVRCASGNVYLQFAGENTCCVHPNSGPLVSQVPAIEATRMPGYC